MWEVCFIQKNVKHHKEVIESCDEGRNRLFSKQFHQGCISDQ